MNYNNCNGNGMNMNNHMNRNGGMNMNHNGRMSNNSSMNRMGKNMNPCNSCKVPKDDCFKGNEHVDHMEIAMSYVPWQKWGELFSMEDGFCHGTIFIDLCKPYIGRRRK